MAAASASAALWQPTAEGLKEICGLLEQQISPNSDQQRFWQQLQHYTQFPDFNNYLVFILAHDDQGKSLEVRQAAGLLLKNNLRTSFRSLSSSSQQYIKSEVLHCLGAADRTIRSTVGTVISTLYQLASRNGWPELLQALVECLGTNNYNHMEGAMDAIYKICEDVPEALDIDFPGFSERPINILIPMLLQFFQSPHAILRKLALGSVNQFIVGMPSALYMCMDQYLQGLFHLSQDPSADVRKLVCSAFVQLVEVRPSFLEPHLRNVTDYILQANKDPDDDVALEACEFWSAYCDGNFPPDGLKEYLPCLIPVLLSNMAYADDDESLVDTEEDESNPDRDQDLKPRFHTSRYHGVEDAEENNEDTVDVWNLRKCSAAGLDTLSNVFGDEILPTVMPLIQTKLSTRSDIDWKETEAAVLTIGAIAEGCINGLYPHLHEIIAFLIPLLDDKFPLIRSITCWTLSRYSKYIMQTIDHGDGREQFDKILTGILRRILDTNKRVQESACSAFANLEEEAAEELAPHLEIILQHLILAYGKYQRRNLRIVYDAIGTLADAVGEELNQALGPGFSQFAEPVFQRCISLIQMQHVAKVDHVSAGVQYEKEFIVCSLDLLSGLVEGLGSGIDNLVAKSNLRDLLLQCCTDQEADIRQSAFALLGDLARVCPVHLHPRLPEFLGVAAEQLNPEAVKEAESVANNACWAIGELAVQVHQDIAPVVFPIISRLVPILQNPQGIHKSLLENSAITLGRLGWVCPDLVAPHLEHFIQGWCSTLYKIRDDYEKEEAFRGLCATVRINPAAVVSSLSYLLRAVASWEVIRSEDLHNEISHLLNGYKQMLANGGTWAECMASLEPPAVQRLSRYGI